MAVGPDAATAQGAQPLFCPGPAPRWQAGPEQTWVLPGEVADSSASNGGQVSNLVLARHAGQLWLLGAGPTPAFARGLGCHIRQRFGQPVAHVVVPWARAEQALGLGGWPQARHWAHATVAQTMRQQCPSCLAQLQQRLRPAASGPGGSDGSGGLGSGKPNGPGGLGPKAIRIPSHTVVGDRGELGPWRWWALPRQAALPGSGTVSGPGSGTGSGNGAATGAGLDPGPGTPAVALVLRHQRAALWLAPGWLWDENAPPDWRGTHVATVQAAPAQMLRLAQADGAAARWLGEQGPWQDAAAPQRLFVYGQAMARAVQNALDKGETGDAPPALTGVPAPWQDHPQHALNWQRAWRQAEDDWLAAKPPR